MAVLVILFSKTSTLYPLPGSNPSPVAFIRIQTTLEVTEAADAVDEMKLESKTRVTDGELPLPA